MRALVGAIGLFLSGCMTEAGYVDSLSAEERVWLRMAEIVRSGAIIERCGPSMDETNVPLGAPEIPGGIYCMPPFSLRESLPDCSSLQAVDLNDQDAAICRAMSAFPDEVSRLGAGLRVSDLTSSEMARVRFVAAEGAVPQRGVLILLYSSPDLSPVAILY